MAKDDKKPPRKGDHKGDKKGEHRSKARSRMTANAQRDVALSQQSYIDEIERQIQQAQQDYQTGLAAVNSAYGGYQDLIAPQAQQFTNQNQGIMDALSADMAPLQSMLQSSTPNLPGTEAAAGTGVLGIQGTSGLEALASNAQRMLGYDQSAVREGGLAQRYAADNLLGQMNDNLDVLEGRQADLQAQTPALIQQRLDALRQQQLERKLAKSQIQGDQAMNDYIQSQIEGFTSDTGTKPPRNTNTNNNNHNNNNNNTDTNTDPTRSLPPIVKQFLGGSSPWEDLTVNQRQKIKNNISGQRIRRTRRKKYPPTRPGSPGGRG